MVQDDRHRMIVNEMGCHAMLITNAKLEDAGVFGCLAKNGSGEAGFQVSNKNFIQKMTLSSLTIFSIKVLFSFGIFLRSTQRLF